MPCKGFITIRKEIKITFTVLLTKIIFVHVCISHKNNSANLLAVQISNHYLRLPCTFRGVFRGVSHPSDVARPVLSVNT